MMAEDYACRQRALRPAKPVRCLLTTEHVSPSVKHEFFPGDGSVLALNQFIAKSSGFLTAPGDDRVRQLIMKDCRLGRIEVLHRMKSGRRLSVRHITITRCGRIGCGVRPLAPTERYRLPAVFRPLEEGSGDFARQAAMVAQRRHLRDRADLLSRHQW